MIQTTLWWGLGIAALALQAYCLFDALRVRKDAFPATNNQTKTVWLALLGVATAIGVVSLPNFYSPLNMFNLIAVVIAGVYLARVKPAVREITGGSSGGW